MLDSMILCSRLLNYTLKYLRTSLWCILYIYLFIYFHSPKSSHPHFLPQIPEDCSIHLCLLLSRIQGYRYHLSKFIYMCCCCCCCCCCCEVASVVSDSVWPHRWQPTRLPCPWDSPGKDTGMGCHFLLQCMKVKSESEVAQLCSTLSNPMDCGPPGSSVHGIFQARVLEWGAIAFSQTLHSKVLIT